MTLQQLLSPFRRAIEDYEMIKDGDKIAIGLSGGKDSLLLVYLFSALRRFYDKKFDVVAINIDLGFENTDKKIAAGLKTECENCGVKFIKVKTDIGRILFDERKEKNPCSLCSKMRRGALINAALNENCNKLALGHHYDDMLETFFLSAFYEGRLSTFQPVTALDDKGVCVIRPLIYVKEKNIRAFMREKPVLKNPCPADKHTQRQYVKELLARINADIPIAKDNIFNAITHPERQNLPKKTSDNN